ncbi:MAG: ParB N-terminal domain-containing protein [Leptospirales bacterium]|nr:ParB N-terminal domain-containing protein [Leptospirales bacterium]
MAKLKVSSLRSPESAPAAAIPIPPTQRLIRGWEVDTERVVPLSLLEHHPDNDRIVPRLGETDFHSLKTRIEKEGLQEPLHVVQDGAGSRLLVVSGNERLRALRLLRVQEVPAILKEFSSSEEMRNHILSANLGRKNPSRNPAHRLLAVFPQAEYPRLYENLQGKKGEVVEQQRAMRDRVSTLFGWSLEFTNKTIRKTQRNKTVAATITLDPKAKKRVDQARTELKDIRKRLTSLEKDKDKINAEIASLKRQASVRQRIGAKFGISL